MRNISFLATKPEPIYGQVMDHIRRLITSGVWPPGMKIPRNIVLAEQIGTSTFSIQTALEHLTREGLFIRKQGLGTYVKGTELCLSSVGIYCGAEFSSSSETQFTQLLCRDLRQKWTDAGIATRFWPDDRIPTEQTSMPVSLERAIRRREIQALVVPLLNACDLEWLHKLKIPLAMITSEKDISYRVAADWKQMSLVALERLHAQGCRSVGLITNQGITLGNGPLSDVGDFFNGFQDAARKFGLETRKEWTRTMEEYENCFEEFGYRECKAILDQKERPDGLLVFSDMVARGVVTALLAMRVSIPDDLKVVLHRNDHIPYVCPIRASYLTTKIGEVGSSLIELIWTQVRGEEVREKLIPFSVTDNGVI